MYTKQNLLNDIRQFGINPKGTLLIHSSMKAIGEVEGGADTVLDAWCEYMKDGLLIFPTHTWAQINGRYSVFDVRREPACVGILPNLFRQRPGVMRSLHPTHSVAALGTDAADYLQGEETRTTPCPRDGCWGKLYDRNASILFLGCSLRSNTFIHGVEEWNRIPDRIDENTQHLEILDQNGHSFAVEMHRHHCSRSSDPSEHYDKLQKPFEKHGAISYGKFGDAPCILGNAVKMVDLTSCLLQKNPDLFADDLPVPENWY